eukprot:CAMPEP_0197020512 /NCGR_PEP_ID=MMETSP1384-20130603/1319_1 /TAXON_ID=29189 /ORGANISM="Ammonia sp." /LENGTH=152 /DNA_ID=CAMNT_0042448157 /DNA_START=25 /DNA_END=483 /DNA_ORIENTATION=+
MAAFKPGTQRAINEAFAFFADNDELKPNQVLPAVRALGLPMTAGQLKEIVEDEKQRMDAEQFEETLIKIVQKRKPENMTQEIRKAYDSLKDDNGKVTKDYLKYLLQNTGEKLTPDELSAIEKYPGAEITFTQFREIIDVPDQLDWTLMRKKK